MDGYYIYSDEIPRDVNHMLVGYDERVIIKGYTRYDIIRDRFSGNDMGIVVYNGSNPNSFFSHNKRFAWIFWKMGSEVNPVIRAFPVIPNGKERVIGRHSQGNDLKMQAS